MNSAPPPPAADDEWLEVDDRIRIPTSEFSFTFVRSSGPGGQNVNKVSSKAQMRWDVTTTPSLPDDVRQRFLEAYGTRVAATGELLLASQRYRDQKRNVADCLEKLQQMLAGVARPPKRRRPTRPTAGSKERRLKSKHDRAQTKQRRQKPGRDD